MIFQTVKIGLTNKAKSQICLGLALLLVGLNFISSFILIAPYEIVKDNSFLFIGDFLGSYAHYRKKEKNEVFTTKERLIGVFIVFILNVLYFQLVG